MWDFLVKTAVIFFPFDLFGSSGTADGVRLLADEMREMLADNRRERHIELSGFVARFHLSCLPPSLRADTGVSTT